MVFGIVSEFNPFHQGHQYLIDSVKKDGDAVICAMSGNFVQRGEFAVFDKFERARTALDGGADLVIEIPAPLSTLSAQGFAEAGVKILESTGVCDALAFGAECDNTDELIRLANEIKMRDSEIKAEMATGVSYPKARQNVICSPLLEMPNNILALEYLNCTKLKPIAVQRLGKGHDSDDKLYSASEIRKHLNDSKISSMKHCESAILYKLRTMTGEDFKEIPDVSEGLENRIAEAVKTAQSLEELYALIKTKRYTHSRIRRIILRAYLGIDSSVSPEPQYLRILGFNEKGRKLLSQMKSTAVLPIVTKYSDAKKIGGSILTQFENECRYTDIYNLGFLPPKPCATEQIAKIITK